MAEGVMLLAAGMGSPGAMAKAPDYPACTPQDNYLESKLKPDGDFAYSVHCKPAATNLVIRNFKDLHHVCKEIQIPAACLFGSFEGAPKGAQYGKCQKGQLLTGEGRRPCLSENLHLFSYLSYTESMDCLGLSAREFFPLIQHESHFMPNIQSYTGAWGVGQLTGDAISQVNSDKALQGLMGKARCRPLEGLLKTPMKPKDSCDRFWPPRNPALNFLYAGAFYVSLKAAAAQMISDASPLFSAFPKDKKDRITMELARMMYNGGRGGVRQVFEVYRRERAFKKPAAPLSYAEFRNDFPKYLQTYYGASLDSGGKLKLGPPERRAEVGQYADKIQNELMALEDRLKIRCSE